jgi:aryl-alcohol dehydrogenase-like predicted oxidoreductase
MTLGSPRSEAALGLALAKRRNLLTLIDTSSNYADGGSERLIGQMLNRNDDRVLKRDDVCLVSKVGYLQNSNLDSLQRGDIKVPKESVVEFNDDVFHCIHPDFIHQQLTASLERLQTNHLDSYLLHNPEYFITAKIRTEKVEKDVLEQTREEMLRRIGLAFEALEKEVDGGRIKSYGISSNSFSLPTSHVHFLPYETLPELAKDASRKVRGTDAHSFKVVEMPANLLEREALVGIVPWSKREGRDLKVLINRPLNAFTDEDMFRLATYYPPPIAYKEMYEITQAFFTEEGKKTILQKNEVDYLQQILQAIHQQVDMVKTPFHFEQLQHQVLHAIAANIQDLKPPWVHHLQSFLATIDQEARAKSSDQTAIDLKSLGVLPKDWNEDLGEYAVKWLLIQPGVDCVLLGMTRQEYVQFAWKILDHEK